MSLTGLTSLLRSAWRRPKQPLVRVPQNSVKLYEQTPPPWARWALVLVSVDVMVSTSAVDVIWNAWTMPDPSLHDSKRLEGNDQTPTTVETTLENKLDNMSVLQIIPPGHVLVPAWKRALSGSIFLLSGVLVAASILAARSRLVRSISYVRPSKETSGLPPSIYIQTASHPKEFGKSYAIKDCWLASNAPSTETRMMLEIKDNGRWVLNMRGARIANKLASEDRTVARNTMLKAWKSVQGPTRRLP